MKLQFINIKTFANIPLCLSLLCHWQLNIACQ